MANLNKVFLIGNLTRDPELRYTPSGTAVANIRIAVNRQFKDRSGELKKDTCFLTVVVWDKQAEASCQFLQKGRPVFVEGRLQSRSWEDNAGQKRNVLEVRADRIQFLGAPVSTDKTSAMPQAEAEPEIANQEVNTAWLEEEGEKSEGEKIEGEKS